MKRNDINRLLKVCLDIAEWVDDKSDTDKNWYGGELCDDIGLGCRALSGYLRSGIRAVMELQEKYHRANERRNLAEISEKEMRDFLQDVFGDEEPHTINDKDKARIRDFVQNLMKEWDEKEAAEEDG